MASRPEETRTTRDTILDATEILLARYGYKKMTIDDLAREVGIGKGSVYLHFSSKQEIALSHVDRIIERIKENLNDISRSKASPEARLRKMLSVRVLGRFDSVQHYSQSVNELLAQVRSALLERRRRYFEDEAKIFARVIAEGRSEGTFKVRDALEAARTMIEGTNSLLPYSLSAYELGDRKEIEVKIRRLADMLLNGLIAR